MFQSTTAHHHPSPKRSEILPSSFSTPSQPSATSPSSLQSSAANDANNDAAYRRGRPQQSYISSLINWLRIKNYQYEVTFSLYMLTPTEKAIFSMYMFLFSCFPSPLPLSCISCLISTWVGVVCLGRCFLEEALLILSLACCFSTSWRFSLLKRAI